jgi:hypothetical protein
MTKRVMDWAGKVPLSEPVVPAMEMVESGCATIAARLAPVYWKTCAEDG